MSQDIITQETTIKPPSEVTIETKPVDENLICAVLSRVGLIPKQSGKIILPGNITQSITEHKRSTDEFNQTLIGQRFRELRNNQFYSLSAVIGIIAIIFGLLYKKDCVCRCQ